MTDNQTIIEIADGWLSNHRVSESWRIISMLRDALVRELNKKTLTVEQPHFTHPAFDAVAKAVSDAKKLKVNLQMAIDDPETLCVSPRCSDSNWGGYNRTHYRSADCPPFFRGEVETIMLRVDSFLNSREERDDSGV